MNGSEIRERLLGIEEIAAIAQHCGITSESPIEEIDNFLCQMAEVSQYGMAAGILSGFIYYADTSRFYDNNAKMIEAAFQWEIDFFDLDIPVWEAIQKTEEFKQKAVWAFVETVTAKYSEDFFYFTN